MRRVNWAHSCLDARPLLGWAGRGGGPESGMHKDLLQAWNVIEDKLERTVRMKQFAGPLGLTPT